MALLSKRSIRFLNNCKENAEQVHFNLINGQIFLTTLIGEETAHLCEYILKEGDYSVDELGELLGKYISKKLAEITVPESNLTRIWKKTLVSAESIMAIFLA